MYICQRLKDQIDQKFRILIIKSLHMLRESRGSSKRCASFARQESPFVPKIKSKSCFKSDRFIQKISKADYERELALIESTKKKYEKTQYEEMLMAGFTSDQNLEEFYQPRISKIKKRESKHKKRGLEPMKQIEFEGWYDDFSSNLLDWAGNNQICTVSGNYLFVYKMNVENPEFPVRMEHVWDRGQQSRINSIKMNPSLSQVAIGFKDGLLKIYDFPKYSLTKKSYHHCHFSGITALDWDETSGMVLSASMDERVIMYDLRQKRIQTLPKLHRFGVLSVKKCNNLVATGGNDNQVFIYDLRKSSECLDHYKHRSSVKAMGWISSSETLLTGGGKSDQKLNFWCRNKGVYHSIKTGSEICSISVSKNTDEFVSCQGYSTNKIIVWDTKGERRQQMSGHHLSRVLYSAISPQGDLMATGAGDQRLLIWNVFPRDDRSTFNPELVDLR